jgi:hypothetical protein
MGMDDIRPVRSPLERSRRLRAVWVVNLLIWVTTGSLLWAWAQPQATLWQFWGITQCLPVFYLGLSVWAAWPLSTESDP